MAARTLFSRLGLLALLACPATAVPCDEAGNETLKPQERFAITRQALSGEPAARSRVVSCSEDSSWWSYIAGVAAERAGELDTASDHYERAIGLGDSSGAMALANMLTQSGRHKRAFAWSQATLLKDYDNQQINAGEAGGTFAMWLLQENYSALSESEYEQAVTLTDELLAEWLPVLRRNDGNESLEADGWKVVHRPPPKYPRLLAQERRSGWTRNMLLVDASGEPVDVLVVSFNREEFAKATRKSLLEWGIQTPEDARQGKTFVQTILFDME